MAFKPRGGGNQPSDLLGLLNNTKLQTSNPAEYQVIQSLITIAGQAKEGIAGAREKSVPIDLSSQVSNLLPPANGGGKAKTYLPEYVIGANVDVIDPRLTTIQLVERIVYVNGVVYITPTAGATLTIVECDLPLESKLVNSFDLNGTLAAESDSGIPTVMATGLVTGNVGAGRANFRFFSLDTGVHDVRFTYAYWLK